MAAIRRTFDSFGLETFRLPDPDGEDEAWVQFGRNDVAKADASISRTHLEFAARRAEGRPTEWLVRHKGSQAKSFVCRRRDPPATDEWWLVPPGPRDAFDHDAPAPLRLQSGDRLYVTGQATTAQPVLGEPLKHAPRCKYEYLVELTVEPEGSHDQPAVAASGGEVCRDRDDSSAEARVARVLAELQQPPDQPGVSIRDGGLRAIDRACELARELEGRADHLRVRETELCARLAAQHAEMVRASVEYANAEARLYAEVVPIFAAKQRKLEQLEQPRNAG
jgi:hypothetical protein